MFVNNPYLFMTLYYIRFKLPTRIFSIVANTVGNQKMRSNANLLNKLEGRVFRYVILDTTA